jgi:hypothetical protein
VLFFIFYFIFSIIINYIFICYFQEKLMSNFDLSKLAAADKTKLNLLKLKQLQSMFQGTQTFKPAISSTTARTTITTPQDDNSSKMSSEISGEVKKATKSRSPSTERYNGLSQKDMDKQLADRWPGKVEKKKLEAAEDVNAADNFWMKGLSGVLDDGKEALGQDGEESYEEYEDDMPEGWPMGDLAREPSWDLQRAQQAMMESIRAQQVERQSAERQAAEKQAIAKKEAEKQALERQAAERQAVERQAAERQAAERAAERQAVERQAAERKAAERQAAERQAAERQAAERQAAERQAAERQASERQAAERQEFERQSAERQTAEKHTSERQSLDKLTTEKKKLERKILALQALMKGASDRQAAEELAALETMLQQQIKAAAKFSSEELAMEKLSEENLPLNREGLDRHAIERFGSEKSKHTKSNKSTPKSQKSPRPSYTDTSSGPSASTEDGLMIDPYHSRVAYGQPLAADPYQTSFGRPASQLPDQKSTTTEKVAVLVNGQSFLDMSGGTRIVGDPLKLIQEDGKAVKEEATSTEAVAEERLGEAEPEEAVASSTASSSRKAEDEFNAELCDKLRVPCR